MKKRLLQVLIALRDGVSVPASQMPARLIDELISYRAIAPTETYKVVSTGNFNEFIYDIGLLPFLLEHDLKEAELAEKR